MSDWFDDDNFWESFRDYMFSPARIESARLEVDQLLALLKLKAGATVLDLCCGVGRHSLELARRGFVVTGVDRTETYLVQAKGIAVKEGLKAEFVQSDMREFARNEAFDAAINLFTSFGYFEDPGDDLRVARNIFQSLRSGGSFVIDILGKEILAARFRERDWNRRADGTIVLEERRIIDGWSRIDATWTSFRGTERRESRLTHRLYSAAEMSSMLKDAGFRNVKVYGSLAGTPYDNRAERLVALATK